VKHPIAADLRLTERDFYPAPRGATKHLSVRMTHRHVETEIVMDVRRKPRMRSLREWAAAKVGAGVRYLEDIEQLPELASWQVRRQMLDDWTPAYYERNYNSRILRQAAVAPSARKQERRDLSSLTVCPYCQRTGFRNVRVHVAKSKRCGELWAKDFVDS